MEPRKRTESLAKLYAKKPISEGYTLWDRDYLLAAMRIFTFKAEAAPPFLLAPCLDALAEITLQMRDYEDACEQFAIAAGKYQMIDQKNLADLMRFKMTEVSSSAEIALEQLRAYLKAEDPERNGGGGGEAVDGKKKTALARAYAYLGDLILSSMDEDQPKESGLVEQALEAAQLAVRLGWDRDHVGWVVLGDAYAAKEDYVKAKEAYGEALKKCPHYAKALERQVGIVEVLANSGDPTTTKAELLELLNQSIEVHPLANTFREKAFLLSEIQGDDAALAFVDGLIANPPQEEIDFIASSSKETLSTLLKAKAAILADAEKLDDALTAANAALDANPGDEEAKTIIRDIRESMAI